MLKVIPLLVYIFPALSIAACSQGALIKANQKQLEQQQAQLEQLQQEIAALQNQRSGNDYSSPPAESCNLKIMRQATLKGGERFAASDFSGALSYYQDALTACPQSAQANLNVARAYEAIGDRSQALSHYRIAANSGAQGDAEAARQARVALSRLGG